MFQNKNAATQVSVFRKLVRLRYQDGSNMAEHMNAFQGLIHVKNVVRKQVWRQKTEKKENAGLMEAWSYAQYAGETESEREKTEKKLYYQK